MLAPPPVVAAASRLRARVLLAIGLPAAAGLCAPLSCGRRRDEVPVTMTPGPFDPRGALPVVVAAGPPVSEPVAPRWQCPRFTCVAPSVPPPYPPMPAPFERCHRAEPRTGALFSPARTTSMRSASPATCCYVSFQPCPPVRGRALRGQMGSLLARATSREDWGAPAGLA